MIERHPEGTEAIPFPHKLFHWERAGETTLQIEIPPRPRGVYPKIEGWEPMFVGFFGYEKPQTISYRRPRA